MTSVFYNEIDPFAAAWLRELIRAELIPAGDVDERSIEDITPNELRKYTQCHFFAGIGGWAYALDLAGWSRDRPVWTGSCPCQPFSAAGKGAGFEDERHLWPAWQHLIAQCRPPVVFGEQVASRAADPWIDLIHADLEGMGYAFGSVPAPAAGIGAPHIRDRNYWMAHADDARLEGWQLPTERAAQCPAGSGGVARGVADSDCRERDGIAIVRGAECDGQDAGRPEGRGSVAARSDAERLADADGRHASAEREQRGGQQRQQPQDGGPVRMADSDRSASRQRGAIDGRRHSGSDALAWPGPSGSVTPDRERPSPTNGFWRAADWLACRDGKWRPVEPGTFPLAHGIPARVVRLRGYGNAIVPQQAAQFIQAYCEALGGVMLEEAA